jgi:hypothetical protein
MRKKLVSYEVLNRIEKDSISNAVMELAEAENILSRVIDTPVKLHCYDNSNVVYRTHDGSYVRANFSVSEGKIKLENIEKLVVDEESVTETGKSILANMVEALQSDNEARATTLFRKYMEVHRPKMAYKMGRRKKTASEKMVSNMKKMEHCGCEDGDDDDDGDEEGEKKFKRPEKTPEFNAAKGEVEYAKKMKKKMKAKSYKEWHRVAKNVIEYISESTLRPSLQEAKIERNAAGDVVAVTLPSKQVRSEGKVLTVKYQGLKSDLKVIREHGLRLVNDKNFQRAVAEIKKLNNISDNDALEESIYKLINNYPSVLYITNEELAKNIKSALETIGESNFDDSTCVFMAEGILRTAYESYPERVNKILSLANVKLPESQDAYLEFQSVVKGFYPSIDESATVEMQIFADLYEVFTDIREAAERADHEVVRNDASKYLGRLEAILEGRERPTLSLAEQAAHYAQLLAEAEWEIVKNPYTSINGDHPAMSKLASTGYTPSKDFNPWKDAAPALDDNGGSYTSGGAKKLRADAWGQTGGKDVWPDLSNPYKPKDGDYTIKGEKGVDKDGDNAFGQWQSGDTSPSLVNPYLPKSTKLAVNDPNRVDN